MALIVCKECKKEFSDTLDACPHCGFKLKKISSGEKIADYIVQKHRAEGKGFVDIKFCRETYEEYARECGIDSSELDFTDFRDVSKELEKYEDFNESLLRDDVCSVANYERLIYSSSYYNNMKESNKIYIKHNLKDKNGYDYYIKTTTDILIRNSVSLFLEGSKYKNLEELRKYIINAIILQYGEEFNMDEIEILCLRYINKFNGKIFVLDKNYNVIKYDFIKENNVKNVNFLGISDTFIYDVIDKLIEGANSFGNGFYVRAYLSVLMGFNVIDNDKNLNNNFICVAKEDFINAFNTLCTDRTYTCLFDIYTLLKKYEPSVLVLISKILVKEKKILVDNVTNGLNYRIFNIFDKEKSIGDLISFYIKNNGYVDLKYIRLVIKETNDYPVQDIVDIITNNKKNLIIENNVIYDKDKNIPSIYERMYTYFFDDITKYIKTKRGATYTDIINEIGLEDEDVTREFFNYLLDNNYIKNEPYLSSDIYFNINDYVQDPRINKFNEAGILKSMCDAIGKYKDVISAEDREKLMELHPRYSTNYNRLASTIITSPSIPYKPSSVLSSQVIGTVIGGGVLGYLMGKEQEEKINKYYDSIGKNVVWTEKIHDLRKKVYSNYYEVESILCKYKDIREDLEKTKQEIIDKHK